ncbi:HAD family hydrolase [Desulfitobacterium metallireducens]|uniref:5'-nucleotidase n=1 Tax=Desulfitobacterium metallireducens DSM 15288 TaxID=871968 RepID=W0EAI7_9FIRM|nr:HAD family hydrolase [Desulfitobacterium metallireducens]AHF06548.1 5'-nucleotidase [Desulfitobacterium metallireducens DSM 15288]
MKRNYDVILFDLDGTLTDPKLGIVNSILYALNSLGIRENDRERLIKFIGPPLKDSFMEYYHFDEELALHAIDKYREYFATKGIFENAVYPRIPMLLKELSAQGKKIALATSKPTDFAQRILDHFNLKQYFSFTGGSNLDGSRTKKSEVIAYVLQESQVKSRSNAVMIGDRKFDLIGAREIGIDSIGVLYGYGSQTELERENPTHLANTVDDLRKILL